MDRIQENQALFSKSVTDEEFNLNLVATMGNLLDYLTVEGQKQVIATVQAESSKRRLLQDATGQAQVSSGDLETLRSQIRRVMDQKDKFLDELCNSL